MKHAVKTLAEILNQPSVWEQCLQDLDAMNFHVLADEHDPRVSPWLFVGCGTSYYLAQAASASFVSLLGVPAQAVPASEILLQPHLVFPASTGRSFPVIISRSGHTSEVLQVAEYLQQRNIPFLAVTCDGQELAQMTDKVLKLNVIEESTVMTSSFTSMLLALQYVAASIAGDRDFLAALHTLPGHLNRLLTTYPAQIEQFAKRNFDDFAFLGQGILYAIASETALKVMESSSTYAQYFHTLEFRHGPKSIAGSNTLVGALLSESSYAIESRVLLEMKQLGSQIFAIANTASPELRLAADLLVELNLPVPELARSIVYVIWGQLLGAYRGLEKGLDPDNPTNLTRVVTI